MRAITRDEEVEIAATVLGSFILGVSFAREFFLNGKFDSRVFLLGVSCFVLFVVISFIAKIRFRIFDRRRLLVSLAWAALFVAGNVAAVDLFNHQFLSAGFSGDIRLETVLFLASYSLATNLLFALNRDIMFTALQPKTVYKYVLAPINGISAGAVVTGFLVWISS